MRFPSGLGHQNLAGRHGPRPSRLARFLSSLGGENISRASITKTKRGEIVPGLLGRHNLPERNIPRSVHGNHVSPPVMSILDNEQLNWVEISLDTDI